MHLKLLPVRAVVAFAGITLMAIVVSVTLLLLSLRNRELEHNRLETESLARMFSTQTQENFNSADLVLRNIEERLLTQFGKRLELDSPYIHLLLSSRVSGSRMIGALLLVNDQGEIVNSSRQEGASHHSVTERDYYKALASSSSDETFVSKPVRNRFNGRWSMYLTRRIHDQNGAFRGCIVAMVDVEGLENIYGAMRLDYLRPLSIYYSDATLVARLPHQASSIGDPVPEVNAQALAAVATGVRVFSHTSAGGERQVLALGRVPKFPLWVGVSDDESEALASWREVAVPIAAFACLGCVFVVVVAGVLVKNLMREESLQTALREADAHYQTTIESLMDAIVATDRQQRITLFNPAAETMFGIAAQQAIGLPLSCLIPERMQQDQRERMSQRPLVQEGTRAGRELSVVGLRADGREFPIEAAVSHTVVHGEPQFTAVLRDVTERRRVQEELLQKNRQLIELAASLQNVREEERARMARELHDDLGQQLTGLKLDLSWLNGRLKEGRDTPQEALDGMRQTLDKAISSVRRLATELHPLILDDLGFGTAVRWQAQEVARRTGLCITLNLEAEDRVTSKPLATALYRIVQESLTNIVRHAEAKAVDIRLSEEGARLILVVHDDGQGMVESRRPTPGIGIVSMRERATALGGYLGLHSAEGEGTTVVVDIPLDPPTHKGERT